MKTRCAIATHSKPAFKNVFYFWGWCTIQKVLFWEYQLSEIFLSSEKEFPAKILRATICSEGVKCIIEYLRKISFATGILPWLELGQEHQFLSRKLFTLTHKTYAKIFAHEPSRTYTIIKADSRSPDSKIGSFENVRQTNEGSKRGLEYFFLRKMLQIFGWRNAAHQFNP